MKQVSFYFNLSLYCFNMHTKNRNYARPMGDFFDGSCFPQSPLVLWQRFTINLGNGEPISNSIAGGGVDWQAGGRARLALYYIIIYLYKYKLPMFPNSSISSVVFQ